MRIKRNYFYPLIFGALLFALYMLVYRPTLKTEDFSTALLSFFAGVAWGAVVILYRARNKYITYLYVLISIFTPVALTYFGQFPYNSRHVAIMGIMLLGILGLRYFVAYYYDSEKLSLRRRMKLRSFKRSKSRRRQQQQDFN